jgi:hypothetical protein
MRQRSVSVASCGTAITLLFCLAACNKKSSTRSTNLICGEKCADYQHMDSLPEEPPQGVVRLAIGGDSRDDLSGVVPWAFAAVKKRGAKAFFFLGDLELTPAEDQLFLQKLGDLRPVAFYPLMGNHEIETFGFLRLWRRESRSRVKEFKEKFVKAPGIILAPFEDEVVYAADLEGGVHFIALDNVSRKGEGFGTKQLSWLEEDLKAAGAAEKTILVGMHKGLAKNPVTTHAMDEDGPNAIRDSDAALGLFKKYKVAMVVVSHSHMYAAYNQDGIDVRLTGGMGAPLVKGLADADGGFHHFLLVDVPTGENKASLRVEVVKFQGPAVRSEKDESEEVE